MKTGHGKRCSKLFSDWGFLLLFVLLFVLCFFPVRFLAVC